MRRTVLSSEIFVFLGEVSDYYYWVKWDNKKCDNKK